MSPEQFSNQRLAITASHTPDVLCATSSDGDGDGDSGGADALWDRDFGLFL